MPRKTTTATAKTVHNRENGANGQPDQSLISRHLPVYKTYKLYIGGKFPRTESGRYYPLKNSAGELIANICRGSRKDFRDAVVAARNAQPGWWERSAYNRSQIIYRIAEMLEWRKAQFIEELIRLEVEPQLAQQEVLTAIDRIVYYSGWADKYQQIFSSVNPVASSHFNFSVIEPTGVVSVFAPEGSGLAGLVSAIMPVITGGNTCVVLASQSLPLPAISFAEVLNDSDLPAGVVNILTGFKNELVGHFSSHMDVNAMVYFGDDDGMIKTIQENATLNVKRPVIYRKYDPFGENAESPYYILDVTETKTTWHPVGI